MKIVVFQPYQKVWTPRTPDSVYDSLGPLPLSPIVNVTPPIQEALGLGTILEAGSYSPVINQCSSSEAAGYGVTLVGGTYTKAP
jgi:hypothetical protein